MRREERMTISAEYPFESRYVEVLGSKIHYIEEGEGQAFLFLHGNPTWSYLWRNIIPPVSQVGRCVAPDLVGFGRSAKPDMGYTFLEHYRYVEGFIEQMQLRDIILVIHDWGGALGFYYALNHRENVKGIAFMETFPFCIPWTDFPLKFGLTFRLFRTPVIGQLMIMRLNMFVNQVLPAAIHGKLPKEIHARYKEPFPTVKSRFPVYVWPNELPIEDRQGNTYREIKRVEEALPEFAFPMLLFSATPGGLIPPNRVEWFKRTIKDLTVKDIGPGLHYLQEDNPAGIATGIVEWAREKKLVAAPA
jgi:pimeloyl-ACP methyl ester carboxylesterase